MPTRSSEADQKTALRKRLLNVVLHNTIKHTGVPAEWIGGGTNVVTSPAGHVTIELALELTCDEPRFLTYLTAFQAEFGRRLLAFEKSAFDWFSGIRWRLENEPAFETSMPPSSYWDEVARDRGITARKVGAIVRDRRKSSDHFVETEPAGLIGASFARIQRRSETALL